MLQSILCRVSRVVSTLAVGLIVLTTATTFSLPVNAAKKTEYSGFVENYTVHRESRGLSKLRNTAQLEFTRKVGVRGAFKNISVTGVFRGTYDAVYDQRDNEFGDSAGHAISLQNTGAWVSGGIGAGGGGVPPLGAFLPHGGPVNLPFSAVDGSANPFGIGFGTTAATLVPGQQLANPNSGLIVLGEHYTGQAGGVHYGVPVQPCDKDSRGCIKGYMDADQSELEHPEFNDRWDFIRELYMDADLALDNGNLWSFRVGKQQIVWGRTDLFRVLDIINPIDLSRNTIYDEFEDTRIPLWAMQAEYRMGATGIFDDLNASFVWVFDKFRPANLGQGGSPNQALGAGDLFRGLANCWDNGCTVSNFFPAAVASGLPPNALGSGDPTLPGFAATSFGPHTIGIREANMPSWSLANTQLGLKLEGLYKGIGWSVNYLYTRSQLPSLHGGSSGPSIAFDPFDGRALGTPQDYLIAFDIEFPRINLIGGSLDFYIDPLKTVFRVEAALSEGEEFADTSRTSLFRESKVLRYVIGIDRPTFIRWLNPNRSFLISAQLFGQHLLDHHEETGISGAKVGMADWEENWIGTLLFQGNYMNDRLNPKIIFARDFRAHGNAIAPSLEYLLSDHWRINVGANFKTGYSGGRHSYDDNRDAIATPGLGATADAAFGLPAGTVPVSQSTGATRGAFPLGVFRGGIFGAQIEEDEYFVNIQYRF